MTDAQTLTVNVTDANDAPAFDETQLPLRFSKTKQQSSIFLTISLMRMATLTYSLTGSADKDFFSITPEGVITLQDPQDFSNTPNDADNNVFEIIVAGEDDGEVPMIPTASSLLLLYDQHAVVNDNDLLFSWGLGSISIHYSIQ